MFLDTTAGKINKEALDIQWRAYLMPVHLLFKVDPRADRLILQPLDAEHLTSLVQQGQVDQPHITDGESAKDWLFTASSSQ